MSDHHDYSHTPSDNCLTPVRKTNEEETTYKGMFEWLEEHATGVVAETHSIADTGDYSVQWVVFSEGILSGKEPIGYGDTLEEAVRDAMKDSEDPTKNNYIPPEYRR